MWKGEPYNHVHRGLQAVATGGGSQPPSHQKGLGLSLDLCPCRSKALNHGRVAFAGLQDTGVACSGRGKDPKGPWTSVLRKFYFQCLPSACLGRMHTLWGTGGGVSLRSSCEARVTKVQGSLCFTMTTWEESQRLGQEQNNKLTPTVR